MHGPRSARSPVPLRHDARVLNILMPSLSPISHVVTLFVGAHFSLTLNETFQLDLLRVMVGAMRTA